MEFFENNFDKTPRSERERTVLHIQQRRHFLLEESQAGYIDESVYKSLSDYLNYLEYRAVNGAQEDLGKIITTTERISNGTMFSLIDVREELDFEPTQLTITHVLDCISDQLQKVMMIPVGPEDLELMADEVQLSTVYETDKAERIDYEVITDQPYEIDVEGNVLKGAWRLAINSPGLKKFILSTFPKATFDNVSNFQVEVSFVQNDENPGLISIWFQAKNLNAAEYLDKDPVWGEKLARWEPQLGAFYTIFDKDNPEDDLYA